MSTTPAWLSKAVFYEIYPQSFFDTNADGIGDIQGIIEKLDYVQSLGCNALWLNPCFDSPFGDAGYDVADFYKVAPRYGTNADLKRLFKETKKRGMHVCLDLVAGHTSTECKWFQESQKAAETPYDNWYIWNNSTWETPNEAPEAWVQGMSERNARYRTNFFVFQPALNFGYGTQDPANPWELPVTHPDVQAVREELKKVMRFWMDMGADGFRVDMASSLVKKDKGKVETRKLWQDVRKMFDEDYPECVLISEWGNPIEAIEGGFHIDFLLPFHTEILSLFRNPGEGRWVTNYAGCFFSRKGDGDITAFTKHYDAYYKKTKGKGHMSIVIGNHDIARISIDRDESDLEIINAMALTMPGVPFLYYGDEIGMRNLSELPSKEGGYERTAARTPMQWNRKKNKGFSTASAKSLYLPVDAAKDAPTVDAQEKKKESLLNRVRRLIALRNGSDALSADGEYTPLYAKAKKYPFIYARHTDEEVWLIILNPSSEAASVRLKHKLITDAGEQVAGRGVSVTEEKGAYTYDCEGISYAIIRVT